MVLSAVRGLAIATAMATAAVVGNTTALAPTAPRAPIGDPPLVAHAAHADARYRIGGRVRLLLFWASRDDVGSARLTWSETPAWRAVSLIAGSNPERAPHGLNQWIYLREESRADRADVFTVRSVTDAESSADPAGAVLDGPTYAATCAALHGPVIETSAATVMAGPGLTYRAVDRLLDHLTSATSWRGQRMLRPADTEVGFLTTLGALLADPAAPSQVALTRPTRQYVYNNTLYDLTMLRTAVLESVSVGPIAYPMLWRSDFAVRNRVTGRVTRFAVSYDPYEAGVTRPVQIVYQPNWWLKIELRRDDTAEVPPDPGHTAATLRRIRDICAVPAE